MLFAKVIREGSDGATENVEGVDYLTALIIFKKD